MYFTCIKLTMFQKKCLWIKITISIKINQSIHQLRLHSNLLTIISDSPKQEGNYRGRPSTEVIQQPLAFDSSTSFQLLLNICKSEFVMLILYTLQTAILFSFFYHELHVLLKKYTLVVVFFVSFITYHCNNNVQLPIQIKIEY